ncbi:hypothetical protein VT930_09025 [Mycobacterium sherrisii]|nr:hypothetical protein [Mycobacterium sherrisii]MEC4763248.1 hypothetical protein [Mycobacterium sherrisii]
MQVGTDAGQVHHDVDIVLAQVLRGSDTGQQQQTGRVDRSPTKYYLSFGSGEMLLCAMVIKDADHPPTRYNHAMNERAGAYSEVRTMQRRTQVGVRRRPPLALVLCELKDQSRSSDDR